MRKGKRDRDRGSKGRHNGRTWNEIKLFMTKSTNQIENIYETYSNMYMPTYMCVLVFILYEHTFMNGE